jgi:hypothetical protein
MTPAQIVRVEADAGGLGHVRALGRHAGQLLGGDPARPRNHAEALHPAFLTRAPPGADMYHTRAKSLCLGKDAVNGI